MEKITTGISTFENLRKGCYTYVDKADLQIRGEESVWGAAVLALRLAVFMVVGLAAAATCFGNVWDVSVGEFARATAETGDSARIQRAIAAAGEGGVVWFPRGEYEIFGNNLYFICNMPGLAGNVAFLTYLGDSHFTDMVVVDYTVGIRNASGGANRYTRCHVWGGPVRKPGTNESEYLPNSIAFDLGGGETLLDACYADTAMIGYLVRSSARIVNCAYYNNYPVFKMDGPEVFVHEDGPELLVTGGRFAKDSPHATLYRRGEKAGRLVWSDNRALRFTAEELEGLEAALKAGDRTLGVGKWWTGRDLNPRPRDYESPALTD